MFCFSKRRCDALADSLGGLDLNTPAERSEIHVFFERCLARLQDGDRRLPQILRLREMLKRGMGVHHAGERALCVCVYDCGCACLCGGWGMTHRCDRQAGGQRAGA